MIEDTISAIVNNGVWYNSSYVHHGLYYDNNPSSLELFYPFADVDHRHVVMPQQLQPLSVDRRLILDSKFESSQEVAEVFESILRILGIDFDWGRSEFLQGLK